MQVAPTVKTILDNYESDNPGSKGNLARSFASNPAAYDPQHHLRLALAAGLNAYAAPLGMIRVGTGTFAGACILKRLDF